MFQTQNPSQLTSQIAAAVQDALAGITVAADQIVGDVNAGQVLRAVELGQSHPQATRQRVVDIPESIGDLATTIGLIIWQCAQEVATMERQAPTAELVRLMAEAAATCRLLEEGRDEARSRADASPAITRKRRVKGRTKTRRKPSAVQEWIQLELFPDRQP